MSSHPRFNALPEAIAMFLAGACRRWAIVDGHLVDLHQAAHPVAVGREEYSEPKSTIACACGEEMRFFYVTNSPPVGTIDTGWRVIDGRHVCPACLPALAVPEVPAAPPAVECCRACGRPLIGEVGP